MNTKILKLFCAGLAFCSMTAILTSCSSDDEPFYTATDSDAPRILNTDIPEGKNGTPAVLSTITRTTNFTFQVIVTPVDYTTVTWFVDGKQVAVGTSINTPLLAGQHLLQIVATTTRGLSTSRTCYVNVLAADGDPVITTNPTALLLATSSVATIPGSNLQNVTKIIIGDTEVNVTNATADGITFDVPSLPDGTYSAVLVDNNGMQYGATSVTVSSAPYVNATSVRSKLGQEVTLEGINLQNVETLKVDNADVTIVSKAFSTLVFKCPDLALGNYTLTGTTADGRVVSFGGQDSCPFTITSETLLLEGNFVIDWDAAICHLNPEAFNDIPVGAVLKIYYEVPDAEYHNLRIVTNWWNDVPGGAQIDVTPDTPNPFTLTFTNEFKDMVTSQEGMSCVGFGYTVTRITYE